MDEVSRVSFFAAVVARRLKSATAFRPSRIQVEHAMSLQSFRGKFLFCFDIPPGIQSIPVLADQLDLLRQYNERSTSLRAAEAVRHLSTWVHLLNTHYFNWLEHMVKHHTPAAEKVAEKDYEPFIITNWKVVGLEIPRLFDTD